MPADGDKAPVGQPSNSALLDAIRDYWNEHIHDLTIARHPVGTELFFKELAEYRFDKLRYLPKLVDFKAYRDKRLLEVGCGVGIDLVEFARGGALVTGVDLAETSIALARKNFAHNKLTGDLRVMNGEKLEFPDETFDVVYAHGVLQYTANAQAMVNEVHRVLRPSGEAILMVYNKYSWLSLLSKITKAELEHRDAPVLRTLAIWEFRRMLRAFSSVTMIPERFPVKTRLHHGLRAALYNGAFVGAFSLVPNRLVRPFGWHIMAFCTKGPRP